MGAKEEPCINLALCVPWVIPETFDRWKVMNQAAHELIQTLKFDETEKDMFVAPSQDLGWGAVYGGQFLAQGMLACQKTVTPDRIPHSIHAYFLHRAWAQKGIVYRVERLRDGRSFSSRRLLAYQENTLVFSMQVGFHIEEKGLEAQLSVETRGVPGDLMSERDIACAYPQRIPEVFRERAQRIRAFDIRPLVDVDVFSPVILPAKRGFWCRFDGELPQESSLHRALLLWMTDGPISTTSLLPHGVSWASEGLQVTSLDHVMWFHQPIDVQQWFFYDVDSPISHGSRGMGRGQIIQHGRLIATVMQEGLMRMKN